MKDDMIGMAEAAQILQVADHRVAGRILKGESINLERGRRRELFASRMEVEALATRRGGRVRPGGYRRRPVAQAA